MSEQRTELTDLEVIAMGIIAYAGDAKSFAFQALTKAKTGFWDEADSLIKNAKDCSKKAHESQSQLLAMEANGEPPTMNIIMVHAEGHLMAASLAIDLISEMIELYKTLGI